MIICKQSQLIGGAHAAVQVYTGGIDNTIKVWDLRKEEVSFTLEGHGDTITGMRASLLCYQYWNIAYTGCCNISKMSHLKISPLATVCNCCDFEVGTGYP